MAKASIVAQKLRTLPLGEHKLIDIIKIIVEADQYQKEGLFNNSPFGRIINKDYDDNFYSDEITKQLKELFPNGLEDLWVDITYQRLLKLKKIVEHLRRKDMNGITGFMQWLGTAVMGPAQVILGTRKMDPNSD